MTVIPVNHAIMEAIILNGVVPPQAVPRSIPIMELPLATSKTVVELAWHIVGRRAELNHLLSKDLIKHKQLDPRQELFWRIKYPDTEWYQGPWGPECLHYSQGDLRKLLITGHEQYGQQLKVWSTEARAQEISQWIEQEIRK